MKLDEIMYETVCEVFSVFLAWAIVVIIVKLINQCSTTDPVCYLNLIPCAGDFSFGTLFSVVLASFSLNSI